MVSGDRRRPLWGRPFFAGPLEDCIDYLTTVVVERRLRWSVWCARKAQTSTTDSANSITCTGARCLADGIADQRRLTESRAAEGADAAGGAERLRLQQTLLDDGAASGCACHELSGSPIGPHGIRARTEAFKAAPQWKILSVSLCTDSFASGVVSWKGLLSCLFDKKNGLSTSASLASASTWTPRRPHRPSSAVSRPPSAAPPIPIRPVWMSSETAAAVPSTEWLMESPTLRSRRGGCGPAGPAAVTGDRDGDSRCGD